MNTPKAALPALLLAALLAGCAGSAAPPHYYRLALNTPGAQPETAPPAAAPARAGAWVLQLPVRMPEYLERDALWLPTGGSDLVPLSDQRWAEPLRDAVPRLLRHDLAQLLGADRVWNGSAPAGLPVAGQLKLELLALEAMPERTGVRLSARWSLVDPLNRQPPQIGQADLVAPSAGPSPSQLVDAHRLALWQLAQQLARSLPAFGPVNPVNPV
ncbi:MAG TPA: ABC-type transport auxiliary lipoprotein family protein [Ideonella sp.]|uniref:PqiC family protein n=1 Tax=Ideonella sp. TaxID=1929293 RepID=UPI002B9DB698|nr:ABC-type transport auxiliary lipoprotein family protein [Ideonella sp.]HSI49872.1 ABC-type transport auxiliary lipoprotein family protein [Ideonella sp.]